ncbi:saccharopine dehydrogenase family protein [Chryseobacterium proteolyticum]|uniref:saccharopine dehydrogenase n=1 Tax=Chryseobacterium proteolyticum TaxID=118127 RepID=UPI00398354C1
MQSNILIIGGNGTVGKTIALIFKSRNPHHQVFIGGRRTGKSANDLLVDVTKPDTFQTLLDHQIHLIILSVNDQEDYILRFAIENKIDYLDITKPTPDLMNAYELAKKQRINSRIVFSSGWMGGIVSGLTNTLPGQINKVQLFVYYSIKDLAGESSAHFMAENVAKPFFMYKNNQPFSVKHFLNSELFEYSFGIGKRTAYNFDVPDLYILNKIEKIPDVTVKMTYNSKFVTWLLGAFQSMRIFSILSLKERRMIFGSSGKGDQSVFDIVISGHMGNKTISLKSTNGQAELTALSAVLHAEKLLGSEKHDNRIYFSHQLHEPHDLMNSLNAYESIHIETIE